MSATVQQVQVIATFADPARARAGVEAAVSAGVPAGAVAVVVVPAGGSEAAGIEMRFLWRFSAVVVASSLAGAAAGAAVGLGLNLAGLGPQSTAGLIAEALSLGLFGHLLGGMWAGYGQLADRSRREWTPPPAQFSTVVVQCADPAQRAAVEALLRRCRPLTVRFAEGDSPRAPA